MIADMSTQYILVCKLKILPVVHTIWIGFHPAKPDGIQYTCPECSQGHVTALEDKMFNYYKMLKKLEHPKNWDTIEIRENNYFWWPRYLRRFKNNTKSVIFISKELGQCLLVRNFLISCLQAILGLRFFANSNFFMLGSED